MRRLLTAIGLVAIVVVIFLGVRAANSPNGPVSSPSPRSGLHGLNSASQGSKRPLMPAVKLGFVDQHGDRLTQHSISGRPAVVAFVPHQCDGECPALLDQIRGGLDKLGESSGEVQIVIIPTDLPSKSDVSRLASWRGLGKRSRLYIASGPREAIKHAMLEFAVSLRPSERSFAYLVVVDRVLRQRVAYVTHTLTPEALAADLDRLLRAG